MATQKPSTKQQPAAGTPANAPISIGALLADAISTLKRVGDGRVTLSQIATAITANIAQEQQFMSQITDWAAKEQADLTAVSASLDGVVVGISALDALIAGFQNSPGTLSAADQAALDNIQAASTALVLKAGAIVVSAPVPTPAAPSA